MKKSSAILVVLSFFVAACGGGGDGSSQGDAPREAAPLGLEVMQTKVFRFTWEARSGASHYRLRENVDGLSGFAQVGGDFPQNTTAFDYVVPLHERINAQYILQTCFSSECIDSETVFVPANLVAGVGYFKASNAEAFDHFGTSVALSRDGMTLAVGAPAEDSDSSAIEGDQHNNDKVASGAVYVFARQGEQWFQQAYLKAANSGAQDQFGTAVALNSDGTTLVVGAPGEDSSSTGVGDDGLNNDLDSAGAVYVFERTGTTWQQQDYIKASNTGYRDLFGQALDISGDGDLLLVGAPGEGSLAAGTNAEQGNNEGPYAGAAYLFARSNGSWSQTAYLKASNPDVDDFFARSVSLSLDGKTAAIGAFNESSDGVGINSPGNNNLVEHSGAVYVFDDSSGAWAQRAFIKADNPGKGDQFGIVLDISAEGDTLVVGAPGENSNSSGVNAIQSDLGEASGALYIFKKSDALWAQDAFVKNRQTDGSLVRFAGLAINAAGDRLIARGRGGDSNLAEIGGEPPDTGARISSAYVYRRDSSGWSLQAQLTASNPKPLCYDWPTCLEPTDSGFGLAVAIDGSGETLAVGAPQADGDASGVNGDQGVDGARESGALYLY